MTNSVERTAREWFQEAVRCYIEQHQGCPWCGGSYRVFLRKDGQRVTYYCYRCDFHVVHDEQADSYYHIPGELNTGQAPETMFEI